MGIDREEALATLAEHYALGTEASLSGPVARGEQGQVWRITTKLGTWALKELWVSKTEREARADADFQAAVRAAGVPMPRVVRTADGATDRRRIEGEIGRAVEDLLEAPGDLQTCHCDLWADNVLGTPSGPVCVIDWENCGPADPSQELGMVLFEFGSDDAGRARSLYEAYVNAGGPGRIDRPGNFSMAIAQTGHIAEMDCEAWLDPDASTTERDRRIGRIHEFTSRALTRAVIDDLLAAVAHV
jgi:Ser/Thr protein kinase RdoA (MazF antagonist)